MINYADLLENIEHAEDCSVTIFGTRTCDCWRAGVVELVEFVAEIDRALLVVENGSEDPVAAEREACASVAKHHAKIQLIRAEAEDNDYARERAIEAESIWTDILARGGKS